MKKRLLSAALALAMVLTMLPLTVFADYSTPGESDVSGDGTETVKYVPYTDANHSKVGWYVTHTFPKTVDQAAKTVDIYLGDKPTGVSVGGKYYNATNANSTTAPTPGVDGKTVNTTIYGWAKDKDGNDYMTGLKGTVTVIGGTISIDAVNASSLTVDACGGEITVKQTNTNGSKTKLTSLTVSNSQAAKGLKNTSLTLTGLDSLISLTLKDVEGPTTKVTLNSKTAAGVGQRHTLSLTNASIGNVELDGTYTDTKGKAASVGQSLTAKNSTVGAITVKGSGSTVTLDEVKGNTDPDVTITGVGGSLSVTGGSKLGEVTVNTGTKADDKSTGAPANVTVSTGSEIGALKVGSAASDESATGRHTVSISGTAGAVTLKNAAVTVNGGTTGAVSLETGTLTVSGNRASVGDVTLGHDATFSLTANNSTIGSLTATTPATVTFNVPNDPSNTLGGTSDAVSDTYKKPTIKGGTWKAEVPAAALDSSLAYQLEAASGGPYTYYTKEQLGVALLAQNSGTGKTLRLIGDTGSVTVTFMNGGTLYGVLTGSTDKVIPLLPTRMNNVSTTYWSDGTRSDWAGQYAIPKSDVVLNAGSGATSTDITKLTNMVIKGGGKDTPVNITGKLVGNVLTFTGAVDSTLNKFTVTLETDAVTYDETEKKETPVTLEVEIVYNNGNLVFANTSSLSLGNGAVFEGSNAIKLSNGSRYTLNGSGLVRKNENIKVKDNDSGYPTADNAVYSLNGIEVIVSAPGYTANDTLKAQVIAAINGTGAVFKWDDSAAAQRAVNAALASITDANLSSWRQAARQRAWSDNGTKGVSLTSATDTAYNTGDIWLVPYLEVNVTSYMPSKTNPSITANLSMKWRVEVHPASGSKDPKANDNKNDVRNGIFVAKAGTPLTLDEDLGAGIEITFKSGLGSVTDQYAHQAGTYDYTIASNKFTVTHGVNGNLGQFVLDIVKPLVSLGDKPSSAPTGGAGWVPSGSVTYFSKLQEAVDAAEDGQLIAVDSAYKGSTTINMTGKARTIYIQSNGENVVVSNASGNLVEHNNNGSFYTLKLNRDNTVSVTNATISVGTASNGTASADMSVAKAGSTVTGTYKANNGYKAGSFTATAATPTGNKSVSVNVKADGTFSLTVPADATSVTVTPVFVLDTGLPFTDVTANDWFYPGVKYCYNTMPNGSVRIMQGFSATQFGWNRPFTRAEMVTILWNMKGCPAPGAAKNTYTDVAGHWAYNAIVWATNNGYADGYGVYGNNRFGPNDPVLRDEMVTFLWKAAGRPTGYGSLSYYADGTQVPDWARESVAWAIGLGILSGRSSVNLGNTINPRVNAFRSEVAVTVMQFHSKNLFLP